MPATPTATTVATGGTSDVRIACIFFDGLVPRAESDEYVEIVNLGLVAQNLDGWKLRDISDGTPEFQFPAYLLGPGGTVRVYTNEVHLEWAGFTFGRGTAIWNDCDPDTAGLFDGSGSLVSSKSYPPGCE